jgi:cysteine-rich repeat protein
VYTPLSPCCGNGAQEAGEQCDDGNQQIGDGCDSSCQIESFEVTYLGYASWTQNVCGMSDEAQDAVMDSSCASTFGGFARAATNDELVGGLIIGIPTSNTSGKLILLKCPNCAGSSVDGFGCASSGHCRTCIPYGVTWPTNLTSGWQDNCCLGIRRTVCVE